MTRSKSSRSSGKLKSGLISFVAVLVLLAGFIIFSPYYQVRDLTCKYTHIKFFCRGIIDVKPVVVDLDTLYVGLSEGNFAFDVRDPGGNYKQQGVNDFNVGSMDDAISAWNQALSVTTNDAESMIYIENARVAKSKQPYVTFVVTTTLSEVPGDSSTSISVARDDLRGVFLAQHEFNAQHPNLKVRVVLANLGVKAQDYLAQTENVVLQQIIRFANTDNTFIGVVGFPFSASAKIAIPVLGAEHIPIISPSASSKALTNLSSYFFRVVPSDSEQGLDAARFVSQVLNLHRVAVLSDSSDSYSKSLGDSFISSFRQLGSDHIAIPESFMLHVADSLDAPLKDIRSQNPPVDLIFLAGYGDDVNNLKDKLGQDVTTIPIMGGDASYELGGYSSGNYSNFFFTAFTYPDIWSILCPPGSGCAKLAPSVTSRDYLAKIFDPKNLHYNQYNYSRTGPHVLLSYDATSVLLQAVSNIEGYGESITREAITNALQQVSFQGSSGQISFSGSDPVNKIVLVLCIDHNHYTKLVRVYGQFAPGTKNYSPEFSYIRDVLCA